MSSNNKKKQFKCKTCGRVCKSKGGLTRHTRYYCSGGIAALSKKKNLTLNELKRVVGANANGTKNFDQVVSDLKNGFMRDFTVEEACRYAGIHHDTYYRWMKRSEEFKQEIEKAQDYIFKEAKRVILDSIREGSVKDAQWLLERRQKDKYSTRTEQTGKDGEAVNVNLTNFTRKELETKSKEELQKIANDQLVQR